MYREEMREYIHTSHIKCGMTAMVVVLSVTEFCNKMSVSYRYICIQVRLSSHTHIQYASKQLSLSVPFNGRSVYKTGKRTGLERE